MAFSPYPLQHLLFVDFDYSLSERHDTVVLICIHLIIGEWRNNSRKNEWMEPEQKQYPVVDGTGDRSKVQCYKEPYCIGTRNVMSMNQGKLEVVKQEMARVNVDILGISELKWTAIDEFNSDNHNIYHCRQESLRRNGEAIMVNKRVWNAVLGYNLKDNRMIEIISKANHSISQ